MVAGCCKAGLLSGRMLAPVSQSDFLVPSGKHGTRPDPLPGCLLHDSRGGGCGLSHEILSKLAYSTGASSSGRSSRKPSMKMCSPQTRREGSSRLPAEIETCRPCVGAQNNCDPHAEQNPRRAIGEDRYHLRLRPVVSRSAGAQAV